MKSMHEVIAMRQRAGMNGSNIFFSGVLRDLDHAVMVTQMSYGRAVICYPDSARLNDPDYVVADTPNFVSDSIIFTRMCPLPVELFGLCLLRHPSRTLRRLRDMNYRHLSGAITTFDEFEEGGYYEEVAEE